MGGRGSSSGKGGGGGSSGGNIANNIESELNGTRWSSSDGSKERIYLNDKEKLYDAIGMKTTNYRKGGISSATINGEKISNTTAYKIDSLLEKSYFDVKSGELVTNSSRLDAWYKSKYKK